MSSLIIFDMDDTLYPEKEFVESGFLAVDSFLKSELSVHNFFEKAWDAFNSGKRKNIFNKVLKDVYFEKEEDFLIDKLVQIYRSHLPSIKLFNDAEWALKHYSKIAPLALLSDGFL